MYVYRLYYIIYYRRYDGEVEEVNNKYVVLHWVKAKTLFN